MPNINIERLAQQKTRVTEVHWPPYVSLPASLLKFPGAAEWDRQMRLNKEREQEQLYRALLNKGESNSTVTGAGEKGEKGDPGEDGSDGEQGPHGQDGEDGEDGADGAAGGAPSAATYIVQTPDATLTNEQALSLLATGLLKSTTVTGVVSIAAAGTDYQTPLVAGVDYENPLTFTGPLSRLAHTISIPVADTVTDGYLSSTDWNTFNSKPSSAATYITQVPDGSLSNEQALSLLATGLVKNTTTTGVLSIAAAGVDYENPLTFTAPLSRLVNAISIPSATTLIDGYLSATDWNTFNNKAPSDATYITQTSNAGLSAEQVLGSLATGLLKNTTTTGVLSIAAAGTDYESPLTFSSPLSRAANTISIPQANGSTDGFLDSGDWTIFNSKQDALPVVDTTAIVKGSVTASKLLRFEVDGFTAATTRVLTPQNADYTIAGLETVQTFTVPQTFAGNVTAQISIFNADGSAGGPSYTFSSDDTTGMYLDGGVRFDVVGVEKLAIFPTFSQFQNDLQVNGLLGLSDGTVGGPAYTFTLDLTSGMYFDSGATTIKFSVSGTDRLSLSSTDAILSTNLTVGSLTGVIMGTAGLLSAVADLPFSSLAQGSALSVLGVTGNAIADNASIVAASDHQVLRRSGTAVAFGAVDLSQSAAVTGSLLAVNGGTGFASYAVGDVLYADTTTTLAKLADIATGNAIISGGVNTAPSWGKIGLTTHVSGILGVANGGTGAGAFTQGSVVFAGASGVYTEDNAGLFWDNTNNRLGIGMVVTSSHGTLTVSRTQTSDPLAAASAHVLIHNPSASAQTQLIFTTGAAVTVRGGVRSDIAGNFNWHASGSQGHQYYSTIDTTGPILGMSASGMQIGRVAGGVSVARLDVVSKSAANIVTILEGFASQTGDMLRIRTSGSANQLVVNASGDLTMTPSIRTTGNPVLLTLTGPAHTNLTTTVETIDVNFNLARIVQHATGAITTQRAMLVQAPTYSFVGASTITTASTLAITAAPVAGTNATITNAYALWVQAGISRFDGNLSLNDGVNIVLGASTGTQIGTSAGEKIGWWGTTPVVQSVDWNPTNVTTDKVFDANATTLDEIADCLGTLINALKLYGILGA